MKLIKKRKRAWLVPVWAMKEGDFWQMEFHDICIEENFAWRGTFANAYHYTNAAGDKKTVFRYDIPYDVEKEAVTIARYGIPKTGRLQYYQRLAQCIQRHVSVLNILKSNCVPSVLACEALAQEKDQKSGVTSIFLQTEEVWPIMDKLFCDDIDLLTLLDVFIRLTVIVRDIAKPPCEVSHRGINMNEVYLTAENKILLGGFYYASSPAQDSIIPYLPEQTLYLPQQLQDGKLGSAATDMQTISRILFNFCSGLPWNTEWPSEPNIAPEYAPDELVEVLQFGMNLSVEECNTFRRRLLDCRKLLSKTDTAKMNIPIRRPMLKEFVYE